MAMPSSRDWRSPTWLLVGMLALVVVGLALTQDQGQPAPVAPQAEELAAPQAAIRAYRESPADRRRIQRDRRTANEAVLLAAGRSKPFYVSSPRRALVLPTGTYRMRSLAKRFPRAVSLNDRTATLRTTVLIAPRAKLTVGRWVRTLRLSSGRGGSNLIGVRSTLRMRGTPDRPLVVRSHIHARGRDTDPTDGRPYVQMSGGSMRLQHVRVSDLGYATGRSSGVAWLHWFGRPARGGARDTTFRRNLFGVYVSGAHGLRFDRVAFLDNIVYGFDPHGRKPNDDRPRGGTNATLMTDSLARRNGSHGIIFSSGCRHNIVRDTVSEFNGGDGFVIDDGREADGRVRPSDHNRLERVVARGNTGSGVAIEGGAGNSMTSVDVTGGRVGVAIRGAAVGTTLNDADIDTIDTIGVQVSQSTNTVVTNTSVRTVKVGILDQQSTATRVENVRITDAWRTGLVVRDEKQLMITGVSITGTGEKAVSGIAITDVDSSGFNDRSTREGFSIRLSDTRHMLWLALLIIPVLAWGLARVRSPRRSG